MHKDISSPTAQPVPSRGAERSRLLPSRLVTLDFDGPLLATLDFDGPLLATRNKESLKRGS